MSANILTPLMLWRNFSLDKKPRKEVILTKQKSDVTIEKFYIDGRTTKTGTVKVYGVSARPKDISGKIPAIIVVSGTANEDEERIASFVAKNGYYAFCINLYGKKEGAEKFTIYPDDIAHANFDVSKDVLQKVKKDVKHTCWYEWTSALRYVYQTIKNIDEVDKIGVVGIKEFATPVWQLAGMENSVSCMASLFGFGWESNRGMHKFGDQLEPKFSDEMLMFVAGTEPESYAMHVKCPTLLLTSTNNRLWDVERAHDTISRIKEDVFKAVDYSVNFVDSLSSDASTNLKLFFDEHLKGTTSIDSCGIKTEVHAECKFGKLLFDLNCDSACVEKAELFVSEEIIDPYKRCWKRIEPTSEENGKFLFEYLPFADSSQVIYFAKIKNKNGFTFSTPVAMKKFSASEITVSHKSNVIYSGRDENAESVFAPYNEGGALIIKPEAEVLEKGGPMGIKGICSQSGLQTFRINAKKYRPKDDAILMFDAFIKDGGTVTVKLIKDGADYSTVYSSKVAINGGRVWYNVKIEKPKFKTAEGMILKSYDNVNRIVFEFEGNGLLNNLLWV